VSAIGVLSSQRLLYFCAEMSLYYSVIFVGGGASFDFVTWHRVSLPSPSYWYSHYKFLKGVQL